MTLGTYLSDLSRFVDGQASHRNAQRPWRQMLRVALSQQAAWAVGEYRFRQWGRSLPEPLRFLTKVVGFFTSRIMESLTGILIPAGATFGPGLRIAHAGSMIIHGKTIAGEDCTLSHQLTIGYHDGGVPKLGDRVFIGPGARVLGGISIGDDALIGANAVVTRDVPSGNVATGVPATVRPNSRPPYIMTAKDDQ